MCSEVNPACFWGCSACRSPGPPPLIQRHLPSTAEHSRGLDLPTIRLYVRSFIHSSTHNQVWSGGQPRGQRNEGALVWESRRSWASAERDLSREL